MNKVPKSPKVKPNLNPKKKGVSGVLSQLNLLSANYTSELKSKMDRLDKLIGPKHWLSVGTYKETILKNHLASKVPSRYAISSGFTMSAANVNKIITKQTDILIWDEIDNSPFYRDTDFVIVPPEAVKVAIEVKSTLSNGSLKIALKNLDSYITFRGHVRYNTNISKCIFAYQIDNKLTFPNGVLRLLRDFYNAESSWPNIDRLNFSKNSQNLKHWSFPWVSLIVVLGVGVIVLNKWHINGTSFPVYSVHPANATSIDNTYGFLERFILAQLLDCTNLSIGQQDRPGMADAILNNVPFAVDGIAHLALEQLPPTITTIGRLTQNNIKRVIKKFI